MQISENQADHEHNAAMQATSFDQNSSLYDEKMEDYLKIEILDNIFG